MEEIRVLQNPKAATSQGHLLFALIDTISLVGRSSKESLSLKISNKNFLLFT